MVNSLCIQSWPQTPVLVFCVLRSQECTDNKIHSFFKKSKECPLNKLTFDTNLGTTTTSTILSDFCLFWDKLSHYIRQTALELSLPNLGRTGISHQVWLNSGGFVLIFYFITLKNYVFCLSLCVWWQERSQIPWIWRREPPNTSARSYTLVLFKSSVLSQLLSHLPNPKFKRFKD